MAAPLVDRLLTKQNAAKSGTIACKALGVVFGHAVYNGNLQPISTYCKRWLIVSICLGLAFLIGMVIEYYIRKFYLASALPEDSGEDSSLSQPIRAHFRVDRSLIARGAVLAFIIAVFGSVAILGSVAAALLIVPFVLLTAADNYVSVNSADRHFKASAISALLSGAFYGLSIGYTLKI